MKTEHIEILDMLDAGLKKMSVKQHNDTFNFISSVDALAQKLMVALNVGELDYRSLSISISRCEDAADTWRESADPAELAAFQSMFG